MQDRTRRRPTLATSSLSLALLAILSGSAWADDPCVNPDGTPALPAPSTDQGSEHGDNNATCDATASAYGEWNNASALQSSAFGHRNVARGPYSTAFGANNLADGEQSNAFGGYNTASGERGVAFGYGNDSGWGSDSVAVGNANVAELSNAVAIGTRNHAISGVAVGTNNFADESALAVGWSSHAAPSGAAIGISAHAQGGSSLAVGIQVQANGAFSSAFGVAAQADADHATAIGYGAVATRAYTLSVGSTGNERQVVNVADATQGTDAVNLRQLNAALAGAVAGNSSPYFVADGANDGSDNAVVTGRNAVAIGANSVADEDDTVAVGRRRVTDVEDAQGAQDAVNLRQLTARTDLLGAGFASWMGGGAAYAGGAFTAPTFTIQGTGYRNVGDAFAAVDSRLTTLGEGGGGVGPQGPAGDSAYQVAVGNGFAGTETEWLASLVGPQGPQGPAGDGTGGISETQMRTLVDAGDAETLETANSHTDAVATTTLESANSYTDARVTEILGFADTFDSFRNDVNDRLAHMDRRIDRMAAMSGAYAGMAMNTAGLPGRNRVGVGFGAQGGAQAIAVGYQRIIGSRASVSFGGAFGGGENSVMGGAGFSW